MASRKSWEFVKTAAPSWLRDYISPPRPDACVSVVPAVTAIELPKPLFKGQSRDKFLVFSQTSFLGQLKNRLS
jgi:hypothetical protein